MCGIAGIIGRQSRTDAQRRIERMTAALAHRGPDGCGHLVRGRVALGHRRLSIIDLEGGRQPLANEDESVRVTFNGEIYNHAELADQLRAAGHVFRTRCDTEVIVHAYEQWGPDCVERFRGMFAFAVADFRARRVLLARDHFGIKPLHYRIGPGRLSFASELPALRQADDATLMGDPLAVELYLRYQYIPTPHTIYRDVYKLPPAHYAIVDFEGRLTTPPTRYWDLQFTAAPRMDEHEWLGRIEAAIHDSVKAHLIADVPVGLFLSGGIDSTLIAHHASQLSDRPLMGFGIGFDDTQFNEMAHARQAAAACRIDFHEQTVTDAALDLLPDLVAQYGEPYGDSSAIPTYLVSRFARQSVPVVLTGDGGDEAFGGYDTYLRWMAKASWRQARDYYRIWPRMGMLWAMGAIRRRLATRLPGGGHDLSDWQSLLLHTSDAMRRGLWRDEFADVATESCRLFEDAGRRARRMGRIDFAQYLDYQTYLPCDILTKVDIASMAHGLEARPPLVDRHVVELAASMPASLRHALGPDGEPEGKPVLKRLLGGVLPESFIHRPKQGFAIPKPRWMSSPRQRDRLEALMLSNASPLRRLFKASALEALYASHRRGDNQSGRMWLLLVLGLWMDQNPDVHFAPSRQPAAVDIRTFAPTPARATRAA